MNYANKNTHSKLNKSVNLSLKILFKHITIKDSLCVGFKTMNWRNSLVNRGHYSNLEICAFVKGNI